jgi:hypothetical protein
VSAPQFQATMQLRVRLDTYFLLAFCNLLKKFIAKTKKSQQDLNFTGFNEQHQ